MNRVTKKTLFLSCVLAISLGLQIGSIEKSWADNQPTESKSTEIIQFENLSIKVSGSGQDLIFIPGLNSRYDVFEETCTRLQNTLPLGARCHLVQLPGFAGASPMDNVTQGFLEPISDQLIRYIKKQNINKPILVGHSLGGFASLLIATKQPKLISKLVIVDSLAYFPAVQNPTATVEQMRPMAELVKKTMLAISEEQFKQRIPMQLMGMTRDKSRIPTLTQWGETTDRATMAQAMYDMQTTDLRSKLDAIEAPAIIFGAWSAYEAYGTTKEITKNMFVQQYKTLEDKDIYISDHSYHFIMWDDLDWLVKHTATFLSASK